MGHYAGSTLQDYSKLLTVNTEPIFITENRDITNTRIRPNNTDQPPQHGGSNAPYRECPNGRRRKGENRDGKIRVLKRDIADKIRHVK
jgi:hypothetical protein